MRRGLRYCLWGLIVLIAAGGALFGYFVYSPGPEVPRLSGTLTKATIEVGGPADERGFAVVYPDAYEGYWNACNIVGDYSANKLNIDDVGFLTGMVDKLIAEISIDPDRVFATGISRGGHMAFRLALEAPSRFRAVAAVSASVPTPENSNAGPRDEALLPS